MLYSCQTEKEPPTLTDLRLIKGRGPCEMWSFVVWHQREQYIPLITVHTQHWSCIVKLPLSQVYTNELVNQRQRRSLSGMQICNLLLFKTGKTSARRQWGVVHFPRLVARWRMWDLRHPAALMINSRWQRDLQGLLVRGHGRLCLCPCVWRDHKEPELPGSPKSGAAVLRAVTGLENSIPLLRSDLKESEEGINHPPARKSASQNKAYYLLPRYLIAESFSPERPEHGEEEKEREREEMSMFREQWPQCRESESVSTKLMDVDNITFVQDRKRQEQTQHMTV